MLAHYGYKDGSGEYFIVIDTDECIECPGPCVEACPNGVLERIEDDYGDMVAAVTEGHRKKIKYSCAPCKPVTCDVTPPCLQACESRAMTHSW